MRVIVGADHGGVVQKDKLIAELQAAGHIVEDVGGHSSTEPDDYPDYALQVGRAVQADGSARGILFCRSGQGMEMAVNKLKGIRAALVWRPDIAVETRKDNDANVLVLPSDFVADHDVSAISQAFLSTEFSGEERHQRRIDKMKELEHE